MGVNINDLTEVSMTNAEDIVTVTTMAMDSFLNHVGRCFCHDVHGALEVLVQFENVTP